MGISGSDKSLLYALAGVERAGATRADDTLPHAFVSIGGVALAKGSESSLTVVEELNEASNTARVTTYHGATEPVEGQNVVITLGSINNRKRTFAGSVINRTHAFVGTPANWNAQPNFIDYTWQLSRRRFSGSFTNTAPSAIAAAIVAVVPGFTLWVEPGLPTLAAFSQTDVSALEALTALAKASGAYCDVDYNRLVKLFATSDGLTAPTDLTSAHLSLEEFSFFKDFSRTRTRIYSEGGGVTALTQISPGETILPLSTVAWYNAAGGQVKSGPQHVSYGGLFVGGGGSLVGLGASPSAVPALTLVAGAGLGIGIYQYAYTDITAAGESLPSPLATITTGLLTPPLSAPSLAAVIDGVLGVGIYQYAYTDVTATGETLPSPLGSVTTTTQAAPTVAPVDNGELGSGALVVGGHYSWAYTWVSFTGAETLVGPLLTKTMSATFTKQDLVLPSAAPGGMSGLNLYRTVNGGSQLKFVAGPILGPIYLDGASDASLGANAPTVATAGLRQVNVSGIATGPTGTTSRKVYRTVVGGSQLKLLTTIGDNTTTTFADNTADGSLGANAPTTATAIAQQVTVSGIAIGASPTTSRKVYRTAVGGSQLKLLTTLANNTATTFADSTADGSLGANAPTADTSGITQVAGQINAGQTTLLVAGAGPFSSAGGWSVIGNGQQIIRYTGISGNTLTGIPTSGIGAITASVTYGTTITASPALTGIPASGQGSVVYTILQGDQVNLLVQVDDLAAQAALAAILSNDGIVDDGIIEDHIIDGTIGETEARARGTAILALKSTAQVTIRYRCRDKNTHAGGLVTANFGAPTNLVGQFRIQHVTISGFTPGMFPLRVVEASNDRFSLEDLLRVTRQRAA